MRTIGFVISHKENEQRRALVPSDLSDIRNVQALYFEKGYGDALGFGDEDYTNAGANVVDRATAFEQDIVCNPKAPEMDERPCLRDGQTLFGWIHAVQSRSITDLLVAKKMTAIAWEDMYDRGRHVFWRNNELAGEMSVLQAMQYLGLSGCECSAAVIGCGNTGRGALMMLEKLGASVVIYDRHSAPYLRGELGSYDIVVNAVLWDVFRTDRLIYREDLARMRPGAMIIDISCDDAMEIETSHATTLADPVYQVDGIFHYVADHTPALVWKSASRSISSAVKHYIDALVESKSHDVIDAATIIRDGVILDERITRFQHRA